MNLISNVKVNVRQLSPGVMFTSDGLSKLWNEMVMDGELCGKKSAGCVVKF